VSLALGATERPDALARLRAGAAALLARQHGRFGPWLAVALGAGVLLYFGQPTEPGPGALLLAVPLIGLALVVSRRAPLSGWMLALGAAGCLGFGIAGWHAARLPPPLELPRWAVQITGEVAEVEALPEGQRVTLRRVRIAGGEPLPRDIRIRLRESDPARPLPGDLLAARAILREPGGPVVPGGWDFARAAYFSGLGGSGTALGPVAVTRGAGEMPAFARLRAQLEAQVAAAIPGPAGAVAAALLTGSQAAIPPAEIVAMRDSGLAHLLSVSGLHMTIVMGSVFGLLRLLVALVPWLALRANGKAVAAIGSLLAGLGYTLLTGAQVPMQRCLVMAALVTLGILAGRRALTVRTLALAAAAVLLVSPAQVLGPSFQMSFAAVLALAAGWEALRGRLPAARGWRRKLALAAFGLVLTSVLAGAATTPFGLHHFGRLQIYGVAANALAVPITSILVMPAGMIALLLMPFGLEGPALWAMGQGVAAILAVAAWVAAWPEAAPVLPPLPGGALAVMSFGFCWLALWRGALRLVGLPIMLGAVVAALQVPPPAMLVTGDARVIALRTGQGVFLHTQAGASAFVRNAVLRQLGAASGLPLPASGEAAGGAIACTPVACRFRPRPEGPEIVLFRTAPPARGARGGAPPDAAVLDEACGQAALLVATEPIRRRCPGSAVIDRFTVWREGAQAVRLSPGGVVVLSERGLRGERPWVPLPPLPGRPDPQPVAPRDPGA
jgi:competence protein ComEC